MNAEQPWDAGLQPERTSLAWRRMGLGFLGVGLALPRITYPELGWVALPGSIAALACALGLLSLGHLRYRSFHRTLTSDDSLTSGGRLPLLVACTTLLIGVTAVLFLVKGQS